MPELSQNRKVEPSESNEKEARKSGSSTKSETVVRNEPASDPWVIGSSIVRRNEPDDED